MTGRGIPNEAMAARSVLKDYVNGRLLFCHLRPDYDRTVHGEIQQSGFVQQAIEEALPEAWQQQEEDKKEQLHDDGENEGEDQEDDDDEEEAAEEVHSL